MEGLGKLWVGLHLPQYIELRIIKLVKANLINYETIVL